MNIPQVAAFNYKKIQNRFFISDRKLRWDARINIVTDDEWWKMKSAWMAEIESFLCVWVPRARDFGATISLTCVSDRQSVFVNPLDPLQACKWCHCRFSGQIVRFYWNWIVQDRRSDWSRLFRLESVSKKPKLTGATNYTPNKVFKPIWAC